jgi:hypothetical protein
MSGLRRRIAAFGVPGATATERKGIRASLREYAQKAEGILPVDDNRYSNAEVASARRQPTRTVTDLLRNHRRRNDLQQIETGIKQLADAHAAHQAAREAVEGFNADDYPNAAKGEVDRCRGIIDELKERYADFLKLREVTEGQLAIRRLLHPRLANAIDSVVFLADLLFFWKAFIRIFDVNWTWQLEDLLGIAATMLLSLVGPTIVLMCARTIGKIVALRRAQRDSKRLGLAIGDEQRDPEQTAGAPERSTRPPQSWWRRLVHRIRLLITKLTSAAAAGWAGTLYLAGSVLVLVSLCYSLTARDRLSLATTQVGDAGQSLQFIAALLFALPVAAMIVHIATSNHLADVLARIEAEFDTAETRLRGAREAAALHDQTVNRHRDELMAGRQQTAASWVGEWNALFDLTCYLHSTIIEDREYHRDRGIRIFFATRAVIDELPLYPAAALDGDLSSPVPDWAAPYRDDGVPHLHGAWAALADHLPPGVDLKRIARWQDPHIAPVRPGDVYIVEAESTLPPR